ncbi:OmpA family protein [Membranicola marinus]|uniref:OmpA family protein n=1 Tax=Membranihabitans marinus TaxID=1227546 RepID=A0A953HW70_9BACT|nr:OmpA family protein [Membranihabitans marinus]MBY5959615.1 OmpA family protein [Membranihabitans marinus]
MKNLLFAIILALISSSVNYSCNASKKLKGAVIGAVVGGATGAVITKNNKAAGIILGAGVGGVAGGLIGNYMDKQAREIADDLEGAHVERVGEGIVVIFDSGLLFDFDSYDLKPATQANLTELAESMKKYEETEIKILGHTDSKGSKSYNKNLSRQRADAVYNYLTTQGIGSARLDTQGYGETDPVASNATDEGRQQNRRVEIVIVANEELKEAAQDGKDLTFSLP